MKTTWYDTIKYWNGKEILRECKDKIDYVFMQMCGTPAQISFVRKEIR